MDEGSMNFKVLIQVTLTPKGEQRPPKAALKRVYQNCSRNTCWESLFEEPTGSEEYR